MNLTCLRIQEISLINQRLNLGDWRVLITEGTEQSIIYPQSSNLVLDLYCTNQENLITICSAIEP